MTLSESRLVRNTILDMVVFTTNSRRNVLQGTSDLGSGRRRGRRSGASRPARDSALAGRSLTSVVRVGRRLLQSALDDPGGDLGTRTETEPTQDPLNVI